MTYKEDLICKLFHSTAFNSSLKFVEKRSKRNYRPENQFVTLKTSLSF